MWLLRVQENAKQELHGFMYGLLVVTLTKLSAIECNIALPVDLPGVEYMDQVIKHQQYLAHTFCDHMTNGQLYEKVNVYHKEFYNSMIKEAKMVSICLLHYFCVHNVSFKFRKVCTVLGSSTNNPNSPPQYIDRNGKGVHTAGEMLQTLFLTVWYDMTSLALKRPSLYSLHSGKFQNWLILLHYDLLHSIMTRSAPPWLTLLHHDSLRSTMTCSTPLWLALPHYDPSTLPWHRDLTQ